ncbi:hypothetical protein ABT040_22295 [Streptomyces sp. NPDC002688]|uniref:hypothetical protein n=1 Tax=Streptomyces sp. NPDC002688 TaxID=3154423 RepID=UPI00332322A6
MASLSTPPGGDANSGTVTTTPSTGGTSDADSSSGSGSGGLSEENRRKIQYGIAAALALAGAGQLLSANLFVTNSWLRMVLTVGAACTAVGVVQLLPQSWHTRMSALAVTFATVAGIVPLFLVEPGDDPPKVDPVALAALVERGPFDQKLPDPLVPGRLTSTNSGSESGPTKLTAVQLKINVDPEVGVLLPGDSGEETFHIFAFLEIYPKDDDAKKRGEAHIKDLDVWDTPLDRSPNVGNYCFQGAAVEGATAAYWECGGVRGDVFASVTLTPGDNAHLGVARDTVSALLNYADSMAKKATPSQ